MTSGVYPHKKGYRRPKEAREILFKTMEEIGEFGELEF
jgi:hypothetical protein